MSPRPFLCPRVQWRTCPCCRGTRLSTLLLAATMVAAMAVLIMLGAATAAPPTLAVLVTVPAVLRVPAAALALKGNPCRGGELWVKLWNW